MIDNNKWIDLVGFFFVRHFNVPNKNKVKLVADDAVCTEVTVKDTHARAHKAHLGPAAERASPIVLCAL